MVKFEDPRIDIGRKGDPIKFKGFDTKEEPLPKPQNISMKNLFPPTKYHIPLDIPDVKLDKEVRFKRDAVSVPLRKPASTGEKFDSTFRAPTGEKFDPTYRAPTVYKPQTGNLNLHFPTFEGK